MASDIPQRKSAPTFKCPKTTLRDATMEDMSNIKTRIKYHTLKFFGTIDIDYKFRTSIYSFVLEHETGKMAAYANFENVPNIPALPKAYWLDWLHYFYGMKSANYGNTLFLTFLIVDDPYNPALLKSIFTEVFLREPKCKFICVVAPPIDCIYEDILEKHCRKIKSLDESINRLSQSLFVCEKNDIIPKMRLRRALAEDNDDLVEIIDEQLKTVRRNLGDFYIAEQVLRNDPTELIIVAEIQNVTVGMIWINSNIHRKALADNFNLNAYANFLLPQKGVLDIDARNVIELAHRRSTMYFDKGDPITGSEEPPKPRSSKENRMSMNNLYISSSESSEDDPEEPPKTLFDKWTKINKNLTDTRNYMREVGRVVNIPYANEVTNAFAVQLFGLTSSIDPRRIFDLVAAAFGSHPEKEYCLISLSSGESSTDSLSGPLLKYFSRVVPRPGCKISDCLYITHRASFIVEIEVRHITEADVPDIEALMCVQLLEWKEECHSAEVMARMIEFLENPWSSCEVLIIYCANCPIGFAVIKQNTVMCELRTNYVVYEDMDDFPDWKGGELMYLLLHPAFVWEWVHISRELFRLTGYLSFYFKFMKQYNHPTMNSILINMFPLFPRKRVYRTAIEPYALYYLSIKVVHIRRDQIENKIVIIGFNETCKGFLRTLIFSPASKFIQCVNITVITDCPGFIEAEYDLKSFEKQDSMFFQAKNQFNADYLRRLEFRTWVTFIAGKLKGIKGEEKRIVLENGTTLRYDRLFLMCSSRYSAPKTVTPLPSNYLEVNSRLDKIIFYQKIRLLATEKTERNLPIIVYGTVVMAHSCLYTLIELGIKPSLICLVVPRMRGKIDFPETFDDDYVVKMIQGMEEAAGVKVFKNLKFIDFGMKTTEDAIESAIFESDFERIAIKCVAFISFHGESLSKALRGVLTMNDIRLADNRIVIDQYSRTTLPYVYACGRITTYQEKLFAGQIEQRFFNQIDVGNHLAKNFIHERRTGEQLSMLESNFMKPIFRQSQLITGIIYGGLRKPGRYVSREIRKNLHSYGHDLITGDENGEYCRVCLDKNGFVSEITCTTRKYENVEIIYRIYGVHEKLLNNMKTRCQSGEIENLLDYFHEAAFATVIHDQFILFRQEMRKRNLECLKVFLKDKTRIDRAEVHQYLNSKGMTEAIEQDLIAFIKKHWKSLRPHYALPEDFAKYE